LFGLAVSAIFAAPASAGEDKSKKKGGGLSYIQLEPLTAALSFVQGRRKIMSIECGIDVPDAGLRDRAQKSVLILRDAYLRWLSVYAASLPPETPPNPDAIEAEMQRKTDAVLGRPGARFVLGTIMVN
jgi:flagellar basal body-associated protein FliL